MTKDEVKKIAKKYNADLVSEIGRSGALYELKAENGPNFCAEVIKGGASVNSNFNKKTQIYSVSIFTR